MRALVGCLVALAVVAGGCGGDDENTGTGARSSEPAETSTEQPTEPSRTPEPTEPETGATEESPEDQPGGVGDEEPARSLALFTGREGRITPRVVRVPAYISVRVELRSADGGGYGLRFGDRRLVVEGDLSSVSTTLDGLRPGESAVGMPIADGNAVRVEATAEPGP